MNHLCTIIVLLGLLLNRNITRDTQFNHGGHRAHGEAEKHWLLPVLPVFPVVVIRPNLWRFDLAPLPGAQRPTQTDGIITGRVLDDEGLPIAAAQIRLTLYKDGGRLGGLTVTTDADGYFRAERLMPSVYIIEAGASGYIQTPVAENSAPRFYQPGDNVTLTLIKGGVITGRVTNASGEPVIAVQVRAMPQQSTNARQVDRFLSSAQLGSQRLTDERGVYRLFGLEPGSYLIVANANLSGAYGAALIYGDDAPVYYPSSTPATARPVTVQSNQEVSGIDIHYRGQPGYAVAGRLIDPAGDGNPQRDKIAIALTDAASGVVVAALPTFGERDSLHDFSFDHVPDGEYELTAQRLDGSDIGAAAAPYRVTVKGADVTGIQLKLVLLSAITGRVILEAASPNDGQLKCESPSPSLLEAVMIIARRDEPSSTRGSEKDAKDAKDADEANSTSPSVPLTPPGKPPSNQGNFTLRYLDAGRYRMLTRLPSESWYVRSLTLPAASSNQSLRDAARDGLTLKPGEIANNLTLTIAHGAASVRGRLMAANDEAKLPARLRVLMVPVEREQADNVLRYAETFSRSDGSFTFTNLAPGKYWILAQKVSEEEANQATPRLMAWESNERAKLRREAEAWKAEIELRPCQKVSDYALRYAPSAK